MKNDRNDLPLSQEAIKQVESHQKSTSTSYRRALARRSFIKNVGLAGAGIAAGAMMEGCGGGSIFAAGPTDTDILNFALNLEYLEAEFYSIAVTGAPLSNTVTGNTGASPVTFPNGTTAVSFAGFVGDLDISPIVQEVLQDEINHVRFLRTTLGNAAASEPAITFPAGIFDTAAHFLSQARQFEDVGVSAYGGAAPLITSKTYLQAAAQILATEAYHAGAFRLECIRNGVTSAAVDSTDIPPTRPSHYFPVDSNSLSLIRTPSQVLMIVYGKTATGQTSGGFFPNGVNGTSLRST